jgi:Raf kinase inhibitor-like YbhB/YbcL family protein
MADAKGSITVAAPDFGAGGSIPSKYTCEGTDTLSPALTLSGVPPNAKSLALIADDPDAPDPKAPRMTWVHWVAYNLPPSTPKLVEGASGKSMPPGAREGLNDWKEPGWRGPCPPIGRHRYFFKVYALDTELPALHPATKAELERAMKGHILAEGQVIGAYEKHK